MPVPDRLGSSKKNWDPYEFPGTKAVDAH